MPFSMRLRVPTASLVSALTFASVKPRFLRACLSRLGRSLISTGCSSTSSPKGASRLLSR